MNEAVKTGVFWLIAVIMIGLATLIAWPTQVTTVTNVPVGGDMFEEFTDPSMAASMKIVTFNDEQGTLKSFEVHRDRESGLWTIPSRDGYPADAIENMRESANAFIGLKMLDMQTDDPADHADLGVTEPKLETLQIGDEGVGRLVSFKNESQDTLASLIIGNPLKDDPEKLYVRIPGQDPVYVVKLDDSPLTTNFRAWIERDLLKLSSIDIAELEAKDYSTTVSQRGVAVSRNFSAKVKMAGTRWEIGELLEFDPKQATVEPTVIDTAGKTLNKAKLDGIKNALDDLQIVDVERKPTGMSTNLRANQALVTDKDAIASLAQKGFYPLPVGTTGEYEIYSANGELSVTLKDGVKYVMRFGNIAGVSDGSDAEDTSAAESGVNRYLLVTTMVDETSFPAPALRSVPQTLEDLDAILNPGKQEQEAAAKETAAEPSPEKSETESDAPAKPDSEPAAKETDGADPDEVETDETTSVEGEAKGSGQALLADDDELTDEEKQERLEAEQEKITKDNQRKMDARKDAMEIAARRVRDLNTRFADWYYVIPEQTYSELQVKRDELFEQAPSIPGPIGSPSAGPQIKMPSLPN
ncbi:MAG: DUF4340 domain-containing protein [Rubripirellula sp.]